MGVDRCRWFRDRLPLLVGDDLAVAERRRVERHLITCSGCRDHRASSSRALSVLHVLAADRPVEPGPSLWPAVARQIRESRHAPAARSWSFWAEFWARPWPAVGFAAAVLAAAAALLPRPATTLRVASQPTPSATLADPATQGQSKVSARPGALPDGPFTPPPRITQNGLDPFAPPVPLQYDLDRGQPAGSRPLDTQRSY